MCTEYCCTVVYYTESVSLYCQQCNDYCTEIPLHSTDCSTLLQINYSTLQCTVKKNKVHYRNDS